MEPHTDEYPGMNLQDRLALSFYETVETYDAKRQICLVRHRESKRYFLKKRIGTYNAAVYRYLKMCPIAHTPRIFEVIEYENELIVIEEYISGETLAERLEKIGSFSLTEAIVLMEQLCDIVGELHGAGIPIIHRDIKPSNIILTESGDVTLLDMNAAKVYNSRENADTVLIGTEDYAAPEQFGFEASTPRTDIYAMGILLNKMLTGALPREKAATGAVGEVIRQCTRMSPGQRFASAAELKTALHACLPGERKSSGNAPAMKDKAASAGRAVSAQSRQPAAVPEKKKRKKWYVRLFRGVIILFTALLLLLAAGLGVFRNRRIEIDRNAVDKTVFRELTEEEAITALETVAGISDIVPATPDRDRNGKLNKQGGYIAAIYFSYDKVSEQLEGADSLERGADGGGCIEIFPEEAYAKKRAGWLNFFSAGGSVCRIGPVIIRTSSYLDKSLEQKLTEEIARALSGLQ